jgi:apolipoprotein D and lipocalin family protein
MMAVQENRQGEKYVDVEKTDAQGNAQHNWLRLSRFGIAVLGSLFSAIALLGCTGIPEGLQPVTGFDLNRYLGKWYEVARLDHSFEKNMSNVTARYSRRQGGGIRVVNRGFDEKSGKWEQVEGKAFFIGPEDVGSLKVSFFGPFYGGYHVIALDKEDYRYAMVAGPKRSYLWILSRDKGLDPGVLSELVSKARGLGFDTDRLIFVKHDRSD